MVEDAKLLYDCDGFFSARLAGLRRRLGELGAKCLVLGSEAGLSTWRCDRTVTNESLARSYIRKASDRLEVLDVLRRRKAYSDVIREAQELVELALKGMLRAVGIEPPKLYDVGGLVREPADRFRMTCVVRLIASPLFPSDCCKERELAFYGDLDFIPTDEYSEDDAQQARAEAETVLQAAQRVIGKE